MELYSKLEYRPIDLIINEYKKRNTKHLCILIKKYLLISDEFDSIHESIELDNLEKIVKSLKILELVIGNYVSIKKKLFQILLSIVKEVRYAISIYITVQSTYIMTIIKNIRAFKLSVIIIDVDYDELLELLIFKLRNRDVQEVSIFDHSNQSRNNYKYFEESDIKADQYGNSILYLSLME
jgi:hypothetical protein